MKEIKILIFVTIVIIATFPYSSCSVIKKQIALADTSSVDTSRIYHIQPHQGKMDRGTLGNCD